MKKTDPARAFIERWKNVSASELATAQSFVMDLCDLLEVPRPHATPAQDYMFERPVTFIHGDASTSAGRIDCYRKGCFVLEAKKLKAGVHTKGFDDGLLRARSQGESYARALPPGEGRPPFVLVADVGNVIEIYSEFSRTGGTYIPFPDPRSHRISLEELADPEKLVLLRAIWSDPEALNPARISAKVTREVSEHLAILARSLEQDGNSSHDVAAYLSRCLFSMFAEDVELLPEGAFLAILQRHRGEPEVVQQMLRALWTDMDRGGFSTALIKPVLRFNGKLFKGTESKSYSLSLTGEHIDWLIKAAKANWKEVEPAIFGTLLERALDPTERHSLGAHYTPRAYVERLVIPTVIEPLRAEWADVQAAVVILANEASELEANPPEVNLKKDFVALDRHSAMVRSKWRSAQQLVKDFLHRLCTVRVLDPACGSGNFLYVTLEHLKRLEGEVLNQLSELGDTQSALDLGRETVTLQQLLGIEVNGRAAALAELVLWIGYLQWHIRTNGNSSIAEPVVHDYGNIEHRDAVLVVDSREKVLDAEGREVTRWDGVTTKTHAVTGLQVPDESVQIPRYRYVNPRQASWPDADFIVGNPPYIGGRTIRQALGEDYLQALRSAHPEVPENADMVMYWWDKAAQLVSSGKAHRFGLITTNSLRQSFNRALLETWLGRNIHLTFAIPDHPWVDNANGAAVRVAMTVGQTEPKDGRLLTVVDKKTSDTGEVEVEFSEQIGSISPGMTVGVDIAAAPALLANKSMCSVGYQLTGMGFRVDASRAKQLDPAFGTQKARVRPLLTGSDITRRSNGVFAIDLFGLGEDDLRKQYPAIYQWVLDNVKPERDQKSRRALRERWWIFEEPRSTFRPALRGCGRAIATSLTAKHRLFVFVDEHDICDSTTVMFALPDALHMGVLCSRVHTAWALAAGGTLEDRPRYNKSLCFESFPFPDDDTGLTDGVRDRIRQLAVQIDSHRKTCQANYTDLTLTNLYNVLEKIRSGQPLTAAEKVTHENGLVSVLLRLHDELDEAVLVAFGWDDLHIPQDLEQLLARLVTLNTKRRAEEVGGTVRWLRPEFRGGQGKNGSLIELEADDDAVLQKPKARVALTVRPWPSGLPEQVKAVAEVLAQIPAGLKVEELSAMFSGRGRWREKLPTLLQTLVALGRAHTGTDGRWLDGGR